MAIEVVRIVDTNADAAPDYTSLAAWEAGEARDLVTYDEIAVAKCRCSAGAADAGVVFSSGWVADATRYIKIWTDPAEGYRHNGTYQTGNKYRLEVSGANAIYSAALGSTSVYLYLIGLQIKVTSTASWKYGFNIGNVGATSRVYFEQTIIVGVFSGTAADCRAIRTTGTAALISYRISNCLIYDFVNGTKNHYAIEFYAGTVYCYNVTVVNCRTGFYKATVNSVVKLRNCLAQDCNDGFNDTAEVWDDADYCCSDITDDAPGAHAQDGDVTWAGSGDYHLSSSDTVAKDNGVGLSGDSDYPITVDIDNVTRSGSWDIGADETVAATVVWGTATATGRGLVSLIAAVIVAASCTATGLGTAQLTGSVTSAAAATATGIGTASCNATVQVPGASATATGRGTVEIQAVVSSVGQAEATGLGTIQLVAHVTASGVAISTGRGTASCDARVQEPGAHATATGRGFASCSLVQVHFDPMARHFGMRAVRAASAGVRAVEAVHVATLACGSEDDRLCGARRLT